MTLNTKTAFIQSFVLYIPISLISFDSTKASPKHIHEEKKDTLNLKHKRIEFSEPETAPLKHGALKIYRKRSIVYAK